jgi:hypothetical protein
VATNNTSALLRRLLLVTSDCRDAFLAAALAARSPSLAALFVRRVEHQERIAAYLKEHAWVELAGAPPDTSAARSNAGGPLISRSSVPVLRQPFALLGACIRVLETSILEYGRVYSPAMPMAERLRLERHHDRMRWSRDELIALRQSYKPSRLALAARRDVSRALIHGEEVWFGAPPDREAREA